MISKSDKKSIIKRLLQTNHEIGLSILSQRELFIRRPNGELCTAFIIPLFDEKRRGIPRASLSSNNTEWMETDSILFFQRTTNELWLMPKEVIPKSGVITMGKKYESFRLLEHSIEEQQPKELSAAALTAAKRLSDQMAALRGAQ